MSRLFKWLKKASYEIFPFHQPFVANRKIDSRKNNKQSRYPDIPLWVLRTRLKQEHERAQSIEAKTDRLGQRILGLLAFVVAFVGILVTLSPSVRLSTSEVVEVVIGVVSLGHILFAWWLTVGANKTAKVHGMGTEFEFEGIRDRETLAYEVFCQEMENLKKHNFNDASVISLRNGLFLGLVGIPILHWVVIPILR